MTEPALRRIAIDPVTRVEGHGKVTLMVDEAGRITQARLHITEFRGFEKFVQGRPFWEVPVLVQRLCGICPVSHHLAAAKAMDQVVGARLTPSAEKLRRLLHLGQILQSHALHFFYLAAPDILFGFDADPERRSIMGLLEERRNVALQGIALRKFGQRVVESIAGKRIHGAVALPGGMNKHLDPKDRDAFLLEVDGVVASAARAVGLARELFVSDVPRSRTFGAMRSNFLSLVRQDGALELYDGGLRAHDADGREIFDHLAPSAYRSIIREESRPWTYMKFPYLAQLGPDLGWYRVGPLARINVCSFIDTPQAESARLEFRAVEPGGPVGGSLAYHWARMIELLHCAEGIRGLLADEDLTEGELMASGQRSAEGFGIIEAPRGTLIHHYRVGADDLVEGANLIVATTHNNEAMGRAIRRVAADELDGRELTEGLLNHVEVALRAYDPCLSCATHAVGKMPLQLELKNANGQLIDRLSRNADGIVDR